MSKLWLIMSVVIGALGCPVHGANAQQPALPPEAQTNTVYITGEVAAPGAYVLKPTEGVAELIASAGGATSTAALSRVTVRRKDGTITTLNVFSAFKSGVKPDFALHDSDFVTVPRNPGYVSVNGAVLHPGIFSIPENGTLSLAQALALAGGVLPGEAPLKIVIGRKAPSGKLELYDAQKTAANPNFNEPLQKNDIVIVLKAPTNRLEPRQAPLDGHFWLLNYN